MQDLQDSPVSAPPDLPAVQANRAALGNAIRETPVIRFPLGSPDTAPADLWLKLEAFQVTGSFKPRGALTVIRHLDAHQRAAGLVTCSSGNHAIAVAYGAKHYRCHALVYMPSTADNYRIGRARALGAEVRLVPDTHALFEAVEQSVAQDGRSFIHPFDGPRTTLGTGTIALELHSQLPGEVETFVVAIGGGSLASGLAPAIKALRPNARVIGIEPCGAPTLTRSLALGKPASVAEVATIADSLAPPFAEEYSFALVRDYVDEILLIDDEQIRSAMRMLFEELKMALEPAGACALAGVFAYPERFIGRHVCAMICGSNIGLARYTQVLGGPKS